MLKHKPLYKAILSSRVLPVLAVTAIAGSALAAGFPWMRLRNYNKSFLSRAL